MSAGPDLRHSPSKLRNSPLSRRIVAPIAALTMTCILFVYARSSIYAAKRNAALHRDAKSGQVDWHRESRRRHSLEGEEAVQGESWVTQVLSPFLGKPKGDHEEGSGKMGLGSKGAGYWEAEGEKRGGGMELRLEEEKRRLKGDKDEKGG